MNDPAKGSPGEPGKGGTGGSGGRGGDSNTGTGGTGGEGGPGVSFLPQLTKEQLPEPVANFLEEHPVFVRLYVPFVVTVSLIVQLLAPTSGRYC